MVDAAKWLWVTYCSSLRARGQRSFSEFLLFGFRISGLALHVLCGLVLL